MKQHLTAVDVKNLCSRKLWELAESRSINSDALYAINERGLDCAPIRGEDPAPIDRLRRARSMCHGIRRWNQVDFRTKADFA